VYKQSANSVPPDLYASLHSDPRFHEIFGSTELAGKDLSHIEFNPSWPPALQAAIEHLHSPEN
jgi:hypothetical protein